MSNEFVVYFCNLTFLSGVVSLCYCLLAFLNSALARLESKKINMFYPVQKEEEDETHVKKTKKHSKKKKHKESVSIIFFVQFHSLYVSVTLAHEHLKWNKCKPFAISKHFLHKNMQLRKYIFATNLNSTSLEILFVEMAVSWLFLEMTKQNHYAAGRPGLRPSKQSPKCTSCTFHNICILKQSGQRPRRVEKSKI